MRTQRILSLALLLLASSAVGCASGKAFKPEDAPRLGSDEGRIYFYRQGIIGALVQPKIKLNDEPVGTSRPGGVFFVDRKPGPCEVSCSTEVTRSTSFHLMRGETRYVRTNVSMGFFVGHIIPTQVNTEEGDKAIRKCSYIGPSLE